MYFSRYGQRGLEAAPQEAIVAFLNRPDVRQRSDYATILARWERFFLPEQFHIGFYEQLKKDPSGFFQTICHFLAMRPVVPLHVTARIHGRSYPPMPPWAIDQLRPDYQSTVERLHARFDNQITDAWRRNIAT